MTLKPTLMPYAINEETGARITAAEIADWMEDITSTIRLRATARKNTAWRKALKLRCPACHQLVYPRAPSGRVTRFFWSHRTNEARNCALEPKRALTPNQINALIFNGRKEGQAHKDLVALLNRLASNDPDIDGASVKEGVYEPPTDEMRSEFPYGRFPDVQFVLGSTKVVLEAQLATITLHGINGRRAFYDRAHTLLLWVMRNFDVVGNLKASVKDIIADQGGVLFSVDKQVEEKCAQTRKFFLRAWRYQSRDGDWSQSIVPITEAISIASQYASSQEVQLLPDWSNDFKQRWRCYYTSKRFDDDGVPDPDLMLNELDKKIGNIINKAYDYRRCILKLVGLLISLEAGVVTGAKVPKLISLANRFDDSEGYKARELIEMAIKRWQPELLSETSMQQALYRAAAKLDNFREKDWGRHSDIGKILEILFPEWRLD